jgi:hypothetical protein
MNEMMRACSAAMVLAALVPTLVIAKEQKETTVGVSLEASVLLGYGISAGTGFGDRFNVRGAYHFLSYDRTEEGDEGDPDLKAELDLKSTALLLDWHPFRGAFRLTGGLMNNGNQIGMTALDNGGDYEFGNCTFVSDAGDPLRVNGVADFDRGTVPYLGLGWGGNMNAERGFYATFDLGVMFSGAAEVDFKGRGSAMTTTPGPECGDGSSQPVSDYQEFKDAVQEEEDEVNEDLEDYKLWPNIAFGLGWRF